MMRMFILFIVLLMQSCSHINIKASKQHSGEFSKNSRDKIYSILKQEIINAHASHLKECNCMKAFYRDLFAAPDESSRYAFDDIVGKEAIKLSSGKDSVSVLAIGAGKLLNELTAFANILARGKNLHIYLNDWSYIFYRDPDFEKKALDLGQHPEKIPSGWKDFYFWAWAQNHKKPYLPFFKEHHQAIDEFKTIIGKLDQIYGTKSTIDIINPPSEKPIILPKLDMIISIDAFTDVPNLMSNLFYQFKLENSPIRFIALNKTKPLGGFWESPDLSIRESNSMHEVSIDIYEISSGDGYGCYKKLERMLFLPTSEQIIKAPEFKTNPDRDSTQSPLDG